MRKILSLCAAFLFAAGVMAAPVVLPDTLDVTNVSFRSEGMPDFVIPDGEEYAGTYFDMGAHDSANDTLLYAEWDVTIQPLKYNIAVDVYNTNSWRVQLYLLNQAGDTLKSLRYKGSSGQKGNFAIGAIDMSDLAAGNYKLRAHAATAWSAMKLKDIIVTADYQGVNVDLPGELLPAYALLSSGASVKNNAIAFTPSTANTEYATWNVSFAAAGDYNVSIDITASNGHNYGVALLSEDGTTEIAAVNEGGQKSDTGTKELGAITVPAAGKYVVKLTNATQWSEAVLNKIKFAAPAVVLTEPDAAPAAPTWPDNQVKAVYSAKYGADCVFGEWGSGTAYTQDTYGKKYVTTNLGYFGLEFAEHLNCAKMEKLHLDVWVAADASIRIVPIWGGAEQGIVKNLVGQEWNAIEIALTEFDQVTNWTDVSQIKIDNAANLTFWLNNVYFYTTQAPAADTEAPTDVTASLVSASYFSAKLTATATDNSDAVIFAVMDGEKELATAPAVSGVAKEIVVNGLLPNTAYNFSVVAKDEAGNAAAPVAVAAKTLEAPAPAPAPTYAADKVLGIQTDAYTDTIYKIQDWWAMPAVTLGSLTATSKALCLEPNTTGSSCFGLAFGKQDITGYDALEMDVYATVAGVLTPSVVGVTPDPVPTYNLVAGQWNHIVLNIKGNTKTDCEQIGFYDCDKLAGTCFIQNVLFVKYVPAISLTQFLTDKPTTEVTLKDLTVIFASGSNTYVIDEEGVALVMYDKNKTYYDGTLTAGKVLSGQKATYTSYKNQDEIIPTNAVEATDGVAPTPTLLAEKPTTENVNRYISYKNVAAKANEGKYYIFEDVQLYGATGALKPTEDGNYDVEGIYILYNGTTPELIVTAIEKSSSTAINNAVVSEKAVKMIENGQLIIMKNGVKYNAQGAELR